MKKKGLAILLCFTAALSVAGCGNKKGALEGTEISDSKEGTEAAGAVLNQYEFVYSDYVWDTSTSVTKYLIVSLVYFSDSTRQKSEVIPGTPPVFARVLSETHSP